APDDADEVVHHLLQLGVQRVGVLAAVAAAERGERGLDRGVHGGPGDSRTGRTRTARRRVLAGALAEDQQIGQRVAAQPVRAVHAAGHLARREQPRHGRRGGLRVDLDAAHHVVARGPDLHGLLGDVDVGQLPELVVHRGQALADVVRAAAARDVEQDAARGRPPAFFDLVVDRPGDLVTGQQLWRTPVVVRAGVPAVGLVSFSAYCLR